MESKKKAATSTQIKEFGKIAALDRLFEKSPYKNSPTTPLLDGELLTTNKMMLEGIDFSLIYFPIKYLGYKAALHAMGYLYANCYKPFTLDFTVGLSSKFSMEQMEQLWAGMESAAKEHGVTNVTLDMLPSMNGLVISCSATGKREAAKSAKRVKVTEQKKVAENSLICINGNLGSACMGFYVLERERVAFEGSAVAGKSSYKQPDLSKYKYLLGNYLNPQIDPQILSKFKEAGVWPSAGYFITKGLAESVKQLAKERGCGVNIFLDKIPVSPQARAMAEEINLDIITAIMNGGEEYRMLYVIPIDKHEIIRKELPHLEIIGHTTATAGECTLISPDGGAHQITAQGW
ncbi:MAG: hypothetical protein IKI67_00740 [Bacteroidales bacterium]|nr:hypothetical protein [Bacteroidales bacterium]